MLDKQKIMILCKVVDNFGDIGVAYRLARALSDARSGLEISLVVSNLESFHALCPAIDPKKPVQNFRYKNSVWKVIDWNINSAENGIQNAFPGGFQFSIILECFQCGRPEWLENLLFSDDFTKTVQIINIDYLTAEEYADEFHLLKSGTRKANIKKIFFMPGFTSKTGGLIFNGQSSIKAEDSGASAAAAGLCALPLNAPLPSATLRGAPIPSPSSFNIFFFAYEDDCAAIVDGIAEFQLKMRKSCGDFSLCVHIASGKSSEPFLSAWKNSGSPFRIEKTPFLPQEEFDEFITKMDFLFVRGEDSLARAALAGLPFVWQAYKQDENYQLVKVNALLDRMKPFFAPKDFEQIRLFWQNYNDYETPTSAEKLTGLLLSSAHKENALGFRDFAGMLKKNGNLAEHLIAFIDGLTI